MTTTPATHQDPIRENLGELTIMGALVGLLIGTTLEIIFGSLASPHVIALSPPTFVEQFPNAYIALVIQHIAYMALGIICSLSSKIFDIEKLNLTAATAIHFAIVIACVGGFGVFLHWFPQENALFAFLGIVAQAAVIYVIIWVASYLKIRRSINEANRVIQK